MNKSQIQEKTKELLEKAEKPAEITKRLQELFKSFVDKDAARNYQRIIPDTGKFYGVPKPVLGMIAKEIGKYLQKEPNKAKELLSIIWQEGSWEAKQIAGKSLEKFGPKYPDICLSFVKTCLDELDNWSVCDNLAMFGIEPIVYSNPELVLPLSEKWIKDENKWIRRFGVVTLRGYKKVKTTDKVFKILDTVMEDDDKDIKKAVAWVLREITKKNPDEVAEFLMKWAKSNPGKNARWIIKDGMKKLPKEKQAKVINLLKVKDIILQGEKVVLRPMTAEQIHIFYKWATQSNSSSFWYGELYGDHIPTYEEFIRDWKRYYFDGSKPEKGRCFMIFVENKPIGQINYNEIKRENNSVELDIIIGEDIDKNKGYGSDALKTLVRYLFKNMNIQLCCVEVITKNPIAIRAYEKAGFKIEKKFVKNKVEWCRMELKKYGRIY